MAPAPPFWTALPFLLLLAAMALLPLLRRTAAWWQSNLHKFYVAGGLSLLAMLYYLAAHRQAVVGHWPSQGLVSPAGGALQWRLAGTVLGNAVLGQFLPFISLLASLYVISGSIHVEADVRPSPRTNTLLLAVGAVLANLIGTTGAAMLLLRPLLDINRRRSHVRHIVVWFIFIVCNCGGCLLPIGDPPLLLGYLFGVPFGWTLRLWPAWLTVNGLLLVAFFAYDHFWQYPRETAARLAAPGEGRGLRIAGLWPNVPLLLGVVLTVALLDPSRAVPGTAWRPWPLVREGVQLGLVAIWLAYAAPTLRRRPHAFHFHPIVEVAVLFLGIFICMQAPLGILAARGAELGLRTPAQFFWATGALSSVLDNAPAYAAFFETARSLGGAHTVAGVREPLLAAISLGAVLMGALTYVGNGPNFMVKAIAERSGVAMPGFFAYLALAGGVLLPIFAVVTWLLALY